MKNSILLSILLISSLFFFNNNASAQSSSNQVLTMGIPEVLLISAVNPSGVPGAISLELTTTVAGTAISGGTGTSYVQLSSIVVDGQSRKLTASVTGVPVGTTLSMATTVPSNGNFAGTVGTGTASQQLTATAVDIVTGIGSCYTGTAALDGYKLDFAWDAGAAGDYGTIFATAGATATVVLTLSAGF